MAIAVSSVVNVFDGPVRIRYATVTMDSSYATGGEAVTAAQFGLQSLDAMFISGATGAQLSVDSTGLKFILYGTNTTTSTSTATTAVGFTQIPNATDLSAMVFKVLAVGH